MVNELLAVRDQLYLNDSRKTLIFQVEVWGTHDLHELLAIHQSINHLAKIKSSSPIFIPF